MKFVYDGGVVVCYCGIVLVCGRVLRCLVYYWSVFKHDYVFNDWLWMSEELRVCNDVPEDLRKRVEDPFFEIDMLRYCSKYNLTLIERY